MTMYAMGEAKYERSSFCAMARMLRIRGVSFGRSGGCRGRFVGGERQEDLFEAHAHRPQLEQPPAARHDGPCQIAPHVAARFAFDFESDETFPAIGFDHTGDARDPAERA